MSARMEKILSTTLRSAFIAAVMYVVFVPSVFAQTEESPYRVTWTEPSVNWNETMPLGNGELCLNAYFSGSAGRLHLLLSRTDSWDELGRLAKLAEVCVGQLLPSGKDVPFEQTLDVQKGEITIVYGPKDAQTRLKVWVESERPNVVVEVESPCEVTPKAFFYVWRDENAGTMPGKDAGDLFWGSKNPAKIQPDVAANENEIKAANRVAIYHRNIPSVFFDEVSKTQGLDDFPGRVDPLADRAFGALISCEGAKRVDDLTLEAPRGKSFQFNVVGYTKASASSAQEWLDETNAIADSAEKEALESRRAKRAEYWKDFAERSWVRFSANKNACADEEELAKVEKEVFDVSRGYALQRFMTACEGRGALPICFNGGLFTTAPVAGAPGRHDYRRWGSGYWFQNTRLAYYPLLASGDFEETQPFFNMYCGLIPLCEYRVQKYFGGAVKGAYFPECIYFWGDVFPEAYKLDPWNAPGRETPLQQSGYHRWEWVGGLEVAFLALQYYDFTLDETFLKEKAVPTALSVLKFFDTFYKVDASTGKLKMSPAQALETWWECDDPMPEVAGIRAVAAKLLELSESQLSAADRQFCDELLAKTPELPTRVEPESGKTMFAPAGRFDVLHNIENPELYCVFPFRLAAFELPNAETARLALEKRIHSGTYGWRQDVLFYAYLNDREKTREYLAARAANTDPKMKFPAFWGPNYDWTPDHCHGGVLCVAAQSAVMQTNGKKIFVSPACPKEWNAEFKLHAPDRTVVEGKIVDGKVLDLKVTPEERAKDVVVVDE